MFSLLIFKNIYNGDAIKMIFLEFSSDTPKFGFVWQIEDSHDNADRSFILDSVYYRFLKEHKEQV